MAQLQRHQSQQQALLMLQAMQQQQAAAAAAQQQVAKQNAHRVPSSTETLQLPFGHKPTLTQSSSLGSVLTTLPSHQDKAGSMDMGSLGVYQNRSPTLTPKLSLTPTNSHDSTASNGRSSPNVGAPSPSSGQETQTQVLCILYNVYIQCTCTCTCIYSVHVYTYIVIVVCTVLTWSPKPRLPFLPLLLFHSLSHLVLPLSVPFVSLPHF